MSSTNDIGIRYINYYVPETMLSIDELLKQIPDGKIPATFLGKNEYASFIKNELKVDAIRVESTLKDAEMLVTAVEKLFIDEVIAPEDIDLILLAQEPNQGQKENLAQYIQHEFDLSNAAVMNLSGNQCANIDYALTFANNVAKGSAEINNILILGNVKIEDPAKRLIGTYGLLSDSSGVMLVSKGYSKLQLLDSAMLSVGRFHDLNIDLSNPLILLKYYFKCIRTLLEKTGVTVEAISNVIIQNANPLLIMQCLESIGIDPEKIFLDNQTRYSHLGSLDFLVNLKDLMDRPKNDNGLILSFGTGGSGSFITSLLTYKP